MPKQAPEGALKIKVALQAENLIDFTPGSAMTDV
jgi:hypothetical protein